MFRPSVICQQASGTHRPSRQGLVVHAAERRSRGFGGPPTPKPVSKKPQQGGNSKAPRDAKKVQPSSGRDEPNSQPAAQTASGHAGLPPQPPSSYQQQHPTPSHLRASPLRPTQPQPPLQPHQQGRGSNWVTEVVPSYLDDAFAAAAAQLLHPSSGQGGLQGVPARAPPPLAAAATVVGASDKDGDKDGDEGLGVVHPTQLSSSASVQGAAESAARVRRREAAARKAATLKRWAEASDPLQELLAGVSVDAVGAVTSAVQAALASDDEDDDDVDAEGDGGQHCKAGEQGGGEVLEGVHGGDSGRGRSDGDAMDEVAQLFGGSSGMQAVLQDLHRVSQVSGQPSSSSQSSRGGSRGSSRGSSRGGSTASLEPGTVVGSVAKAVEAAACEPHAPSPQPSIQGDGGMVVEGGRGVEGREGQEGAHAVDQQGVHEGHAEHEVHEGHAEHEGHEGHKGHAGHEGHVEHEGQAEGSDLGEEGVACESLVEAAASGFSFGPVPPDLASSPEANRLREGESGGPMVMAGGGAGGAASRQAVAEDGMGGRAGAACEVGAARGGEAEVVVMEAEGERHNAFLSSVGPAQPLPGVTALAAATTTTTTAVSPTTLQCEEVAVIEPSLSSSDGEGGLVESLKAQVLSLMREREMAMDQAATLTAELTQANARVALCARDLTAAASLGMELGARDEELHAAKYEVAEVSHRLREAERRCAAANKMAVDTAKDVDILRGAATEANAERSHWRDRALDAEARVRELEQEAAGKLQAAGEQGGPQLPLWIQEQQQQQGLGAAGEAGYKGTPLTVPSITAERVAAAAARAHILIERVMGVEGLSDHDRVVLGGDASAIVAMLTEPPGHPVSPVDSCLGL